MYCIKCGQRLDDGALKCPHCGAIVPEMDSAAASLNDHKELSALKNELTAPQKEPASPYAAGADSDPWHTPDVTPEPVAEPWGTGTPRSTSAVPTAQKKKNKRGFVIFAAALVFILAVGAILRAAGIGQSAPVVSGYSAVIESYFNYAARDEETAIQSLFQPEIFEGYIDVYGYTDALANADGWSRHYGKEVERWNITGTTDSDDELDALNDYFEDLDARRYVYVDTDVQYADGSYGMAEFEMIQTDEGWFFTRIW